MLPEGKELEEAVAELELLREEEHLVGFATTFDEEAELGPPELPRPEPTALPQQVRRRLRGKQTVRETPPPPVPPSEAGCHLLIRTGSIIRCSVSGQDAEKRTSKLLPRPCRGGALSSHTSSVDQFSDQF